MNSRDLTAWRKARGYSRVRAARELGISRTTLWKLERASVPLPVTVGLALKALMSD